MSRFEGGCAPLSYHGGERMEDALKGPPWALLEPSYRHGSFFSLAKCQRAAGWGRSMQGPTVKLYGSSALGYWPGS